MSQRNPFRLTKKEVIERLDATKKFLYNRERVSYFSSSVVIPVPNYDPEDDSSFYSAESMNSGELLDVLNHMISAYPDVVDVPFTFNEKGKFVNSRDHITMIGSTVGLLFYPYSSSLITKHCALWIGTWHHSPIVYWRASDTKKIRCEKIPQYADLI